MHDIMIFGFQKVVYVPFILYSSPRYELPLNLDSQIFRFSQYKLFHQLCGAPDPVHHKYWIHMLMLYIFIKHFYSFIYIYIYIYSPPPSLLFSLVGLSVGFERWEMQQRSFLRRATQILVKMSIPAMCTQDGDSITLQASVSELILTLITCIFFSFFFFFQ